MMSKFYPYIFIFLAFVGTMTHMSNVRHAKENQEQLVKIYTDTLMKYFIKDNLQGYTNLGFENSWRKIGKPKILEECTAHKHIKFRYSRKSWESLYYCEDCKYYYIVDSSD